MSSNGFQWTIAIVIATLVAACGGDGASEEAPAPDPSAATKISVPAAPAGEKPAAAPAAKAAAAPAAKAAPAAAAKAPAAKAEAKPAAAPEPDEGPSEEMLTMITKFYGEYVDSEYEITEDDQPDDDDDRETKKEARDAIKRKKNEAKVHWIKILPGNQFVCNGSNYRKEVRKVKYYVSEADESGFVMMFEGASSARQLVWTYGDEEEDRTTIELTEGKPPSDCGWSLDDGEFVRVSKKEGGPPKYKPAPEIDLDDVGDSAEGKKGGEISGPKGSVRLKTAKFKKKIGFSKAEEDEQYGVFSVEVKAGKDGPLDLEAFYEDGCDDFFTEWMCDEGGHAGSVYACDRPHWGDKFETGLVASGRKAAFNCCYTFEKPSKDCTTTVDGRVFGLGDVEISF